MVYVHLCPVLFPSAFPFPFLVCFLGCFILFCFGLVLVLVCFLTGIFFTTIHFLIVHILDLTMQGKGLSHGYRRQLQSGQNHKCEISVETENRKGHYILKTTYKFLTVLKEPFLGKWNRYLVSVAEKNLQGGNTELKAISWYEVPSITTVKGPLQS